MRKTIEEYAQAFAVVYTLEGMDSQEELLVAQAKLAEAEDAVDDGLNTHMQELRAYELTVSNLRQKVHSRTILAAWSFILMAVGAAAWKFL